MGNEASRADGAGLSPPQAFANGVGRALSGSRLPTTPLATPTGQRRAQSFSAAPATPRGSASASVAAAGGASATAGVERTIQRMDRAIRKRVRGGITYNMRIVLRGARGTGKTSLFQRLKGEPIPETHAPTPQLQSATINWSFRAGSEESVKCEVWDVVDRGFDPLAPPDAAGAAAEASGGDEPAASSPFELGALQSSGNFASVRASAAVAASIAGAAGAAGAHTVATVDATTVDVYHETHGVVFLLDVTKWDTLEYVRQQLEKVPAHIPTLVLGNFRDCGNQRKVFKEDIQDLLYGSSDRSRQQQQQLRRPHELLYFECSLLNCYGLQSLHQYFGVPFLQLKLATIRQQVRIVEGEFSHLKNDLQAKISEQRYADYVEHIKATGSDIRTGRKAPGGRAALRHAESTIVVSGDDGAQQQQQQRQAEAARVARVARTHSSASTGSDIVVAPLGEDAASSVAQTDTEPPETPASVPAPAGPAPAGSSVAEAEAPASEAVQKDAEDLPERTNSLADQVTAPLKFEHSASSSSLREELPSPSATAADRGAAAARAGKKTSSKPSAAAATRENGGGHAERSASATAAAADESMSLEDFQVPKQKNADLDSFYSDDGSDASGESDADVIIQPSAALMAKKHSHKQQFIYSDSSGSDDDKRASRKTARRKNSPRQKRGVVAQAAASAPAAADVAASARPRASNSSESGKQSGIATKTPVPVATVASGPSPQVPQHIEQPPAAPHPPQPPSALQPLAAPLTSRPTSPGARASRSPSPRQKLESSRSHSPRTSDVAASQLHGSSVRTTAAEKTDQVDCKPDRNGGDEAAKARAGADVVAAEPKAAASCQQPESPAGHVSPRHRPQPSKSSGMTTPPRASDALGASHGALAAANEVCEEKELQVNKSDDAAPASVRPAVTETTISSAHDDTEEDEHVVLPNEIEAFFSDDGEDEDTSASLTTSASLMVAQETPTRTAPLTAPSAHASRPTLTRPEMLTSDNDKEEEEDDIAVARLGGDARRAQDTTGSDASASVQASTVQHVDGSESDVVPERLQSEVVGLFFSDDDEDAGRVSSPALVSMSSRLAATASTGTSNLLPKNRSRLDMLMSDDEDNDSKCEQATSPVVRPSSANWQHRSIVQPPARPLSAAHPAPESPRNELDGFFSESDSASEGGSRGLLPAPPARGTAMLRGPKRHMVARSDDDDDEDGGDGTSRAADRFASYDAKSVRKSKAERRQEREDIRRMTSSLNSSRLFDDVATPAVATVAGTASADVLAAIRAAQEEALRMLPPSSDHGTDDEGAEREKKHRHKSSKAKSSRSSSSSKHRPKDGDDGDASATNKRRSSSNKSSSSSSRSSRRRDSVIGDADSKAKW
ncbi:hypothetical protein PybrP1_007149 [[Pythium] brassicae (nom. inval.)]|nr:hypothetical protein PybrP1_007149 [[Pythium] brassicae (nom. inval.)]